MSQKVLGLLQQRRDGLAAIDASKANWSKVREWHARTRPLIAEYFPHQLESFDSLVSPHWTALPRAYAGGRNLTPNADAQERAANDKIAAGAKANLLAHVDALIELMTLEESAADASNAVERRGNDVFIVHGHNERWVQETARFVEQFDLPVVILRERPNKGRTIIEKFEDEAANIGFAIVLLTADDVGGNAGSSLDEQLPRARQNVILELGFFLGKLTRANVCALYEDGVEIPSDYKGVLFVPLDVAGRWRLLLAREMKAAGLPIDLNKVI